MRLQAGTGAHRARLQRNDKRAISEIPSVKRGGRFSHRLDFSVGKRIGMRLTQVPPAANHPAVSGKHDGTDRHLAIRGGFAGERDRQPHIVIPSHSPQCSGGRVCVTENVADVTRVATTAGPPSHAHSETCS